MTARRIAVHVERAAAMLAAAAVLTGGAALGIAAAHADDAPIVSHAYWVDPSTGDAYRDVVLLSELPQIDELPVCIEEDGSGQDNPCLWFDPDSHDSYVTFPDVSYLVVDDTVTGGVR